MMTQANRKRGRSIEDEAGEFMPLSKRINNLHINGFSGLPTPESSQETMDSEWGSRSYVPSPNHSEPSQGSGSLDGCSSSRSSYTADYRPNLDANDNPFYYENNKLLYSLYMERMQRTASEHY